MTTQPEPTRALHDIADEPGLRSVRTDTLHRSGGAIALTTASSRVLIGAAIEPTPAGTHRRRRPTRIPISR